MKRISHSLFQSKADSIGVHLDGGHVRVNKLGGVQLHWANPVDFVVFARTIIGLIQTPEKFLHFHEFGIWPSSENPFLFGLVSKALMNDGDQGPGQAMLFSYDEDEAAATFLQIGLQSGWGGLLVGDDSNWFFFNHDGFGIANSIIDAKARLELIAGLRILTPDS